MPKKSKEPTPIPGDGKTIEINLDPGAVKLAINHYDFGHILHGHEAIIPKPTIVSRISIVKNPKTGQLSIRLTDGK
jgi:hypothetical protein